jgi:murein DD-endopeptidase MepM/ murein hydrolase activator NlpD
LGVPLVAVLLLLWGPAPAAALVLDRPVPGPVLAPFDLSSPYAAGHRGVDLGAQPGSPVRAAAGGTVTFAGRVVDATWVTVDHGPVRTTVGPLAAVLVQRGDRVRRGQVLGASDRAHGSAAVHWSARRGDSYVDPLAVGRRVASLVPVAPRATRTVPQGPRGRVR